MSLFTLIAYYPKSALPQHTTLCTGRWYYLARKRTKKNTSWHSAHQNTALIQRKTAYYLVLPSTLALLLQHSLAKRSSCIITCSCEHLQAQKNQSHATNDREIEDPKIRCCSRSPDITHTKKVTTGASWSDFRFLSDSATATCCKITK